MARRRPAGDVDDDDVGGTLANLGKFGK